MGQCSGWHPSGTPGSEGLILTGHSVELSNVPEIKELETLELCFLTGYSQERKEGRGFNMEPSVHVEQCGIRAALGGYRREVRKIKRDLKNWKKIKIPKDKDVEQMVNADSQSTVTD